MIELGCIIIEVFDLVLGFLIKLRWRNLQKEESSM